MNKLNAKWREYQTESLIRTREPIDPQAINFASNDYLGLAHHPSTIAFLQTQCLGYGSGASAYVTGFHPLQAETEAAFADYLGFEDALLFNTGYMANLGVLQCLAQRDCLLAIDRESHASLMDGARLADAPVKRYRHMLQLQQLLQTAPGYKLIASDSVFSISGRLADIVQLVTLTQTHQGSLIIDDAHGFGVLHPKGIAGLQKNIDLLIIPCGKALGAFGAMVLGSKQLIGYLKQFARSAIYTTALPPICIATLQHQLQLLQTESWRFEKLQENKRLFNAVIAEAGLHIQPAEGAIFQYPMESNLAALQQAEALKKQGLWVAAMRRPTVNTPCLRITLSATHTSAMLHQLVAALKALAC